MTDAFYQDDQLTLLHGDARDILASQMESYREALAAGGVSPEEVVAVGIALALLSLCFTLFTRH